VDQAAIRKEADEFAAPPEVIPPRMEVCDPNLIQICFVLDRFCNIFQYFSLIFCFATVSVGLFATRSAVPDAGHCQTLQNGFATHLLGVTRR
jgi:hypothetical protein